MKDHVTKVAIESNSVISSWYLKNTQEPIMAGAGFSLKKTLDGAVRKL